MNEMSITKLTVIAQIAMSLMFLTGYFVIMIIILTGNVRMDPALKDTFGNLVSILTAFSGAIVYFWFQRARNQDTAVQDPMVS